MPTVVRALTPADIPSAMELSKAAKWNQTPEDWLRVLDEEGAPDVVVLHCFSGDVFFATECVRRGYVLSFAGTVTFKNAQPVRDALRDSGVRAVPVPIDAGGFDLASACAVTGVEDEFATLDLLDALVRKSLLVADRSTRRTRFSMLPPYRSVRLLQPS